MQTYKTRDLVYQKLLLLFPLIIYSLYKNGYLIFKKDLIGLSMIFKPLYLILIGVVIKIGYDLIFYKKIKVDYNLLNVVLISMIVPYNMNILLYGGILLIIYPLTNLLYKVVKFNKVAFIYLIIIFISIIFKPLVFKTPLELNYSYSFNFINLLMGRSIGGISSTSILFSLLAYSILIFNYYYKKDIPLVINITYLILSFIYFIILGNSNYLLNSELIFASIFIATIPNGSPYRRLMQIIYGILIGIITFIISIYYNSIIAVYIAILFLSLFLNIRQKKTKHSLSK